MGRCKKTNCMYRGSDANLDGMCMYAICNGETRIGTIMRRYNIQYDDPSNKKFFDAANCPLYTKGERQREQPIILPSFDGEKHLSKRPEEDMVRKSGRLSEYEEHRRMELYKAGYSDGKAAKILGISYSTFRDWRRTRNIPANYTNGVTRKYGG